MGVILIFTFISLVEASSQGGGKLGFCGFDTCGSRNDSFLVPTCNPHHTTKMGQYCETEHSRQVDTYDGVLSSTLHEAVDMLAWNAARICWDPENHLKSVQPQAWLE